jgi:probable HAF family extracellular repeat protein
MFHGFLKNQGQFTSIDFPNSTFTWITGITSKGDIVGFYNDQSSKQHGFVLSDGKFISIDIPNALSTEANGMNPEGDIVGRYVSSDGKTHGYLLTGALTMNR